MRARIGCFTACIAAQGTWQYHADAVRPRTRSALILPYIFDGARIRGYFGVDREFNYRRSNTLLGIKIFRRLDPRYSEGRRIAFARGSRGQRGHKEVTVLQQQACSAIYCCILAGYLKQLGKRNIYRGGALGQLFKHCTPKIGTTHLELDLERFWSWKRGKKQSTKKIGTLALTSYSSTD